MGHDKVDEGEEDGVDVGRNGVGNLKGGEKWKNGVNGAE
jgi:hypothetical protein